VLLAAGARTIEVLAAMVLYAALVVAALLVLHIALALLDANPANAIATVVSRIADRLAGPFHMLFTPKDPKQQVAVNEGLAAVVYLVLGGGVSRGIRLLGGRLPR
jgi:hypothetical protein